MICTGDSIRLLSSCARVQESDFENVGACRIPVMDGSSNEVMLCIPDESSGSPDRIYVAVEEQPLQKMLSVWSSGPRLFVIVIDGLPVIKLTCWQTLICFISWMTCMEVFSQMLLALVNKGKRGGILHASFFCQLWSGLVTVWKVWTLHATCTVKWKNDPIWKKHFFMLYMKQ